MRVPATYSFHTLQAKAQEICPECQYFAKTTTHKAKKGRYLGFDLGEGVSVGVFRRANSNISQLVVRGDEEAKSAKDNEIRSLVNLINERGFFGAY